MFCSFHTFPGEKTLRLGLDEYSVFYNEMNLCEATSYHHKHTVIERTFNGIIEFDYEFVLSWKCHP